MNEIEKYLQIQQYLDENNIYFIKSLQNDKINFYNVNSFFPIHSVQLKPIQNIVDYTAKDLTLKKLTDAISDINFFTDWYKDAYKIKPTNISLKINLSNDCDFQSTMMDNSRHFIISIANNSNAINDELTCRIKLSKNSNLENINQAFPTLLFTCVVLKDSSTLFEYLFDQKLKNSELMNQIIYKVFNTIYSKDNKIKNHFIIEDNYEFN